MFVKILRRFWAFSSDENVLLIFVPEGQSQILESSSSRCRPSCTLRPMSNVINLNLVFSHVLEL